MKIFLEGYKRRYLHVRFEKKRTLQAMIIDHRSYDQAKKINVCIFD